MEAKNRNNLTIGDRIEFVYSDEVTRIGKIVDIVIHFSTKKNKVVETFIWIDEDDGIMPYALSEMDDIDILKIGHDHYGRQLDVGDFVQYSPVDYKNHVWGKIIHTADDGYAIKVLHPESRAGKIYSIDGREVIILSKYRD